MNVWVIPSWYPPNGGTFFREHSQALAKAGAEVLVLALLQNSMKKFPLLKPTSAFSQKVSIQGRFVEKTRNYWNIPFTDQPNAVLWIRMMIRFIEDELKNGNRPDLIQVHSSIWAGVVASHISRRHGIPYLITEHRSRFVYNTDESKAMFRSWHTPLLKKAFGGAAKIITVSHSLNQRILHYAPQKAASILSIPNMVDVDFFSPPTVGNQEAGRPFTFFSLAHHFAVKGLGTLLDAFAIVKAERKEGVRLIIGGQGPLSAKLKEQCHQLGLDPEVTFTGALNRQQVKEHMQQADAFVLPSHFEAFGVVFIEAMACGTPVIAARAGGPETFITPHTGLLVLPGKPTELADALLKMVREPHLFSAHAIRKYAVSNFGNQAVARSYIELYHQILNSSR